MTYRGFGYVVDSCPTNKTEFITGATRLNCEVDQYGRNQYTCVPNEDTSALVEFCYSKIVGLYQKGHCLEIVGDGFLDQISCIQFESGCPKENFRGTDLYKFPACSKINTENRCFYADPSCSNRTENLNNTSSTVGGIINHTLSMLTTETGIVVEESSDAGVIIGSTYFVVLILFLVLAIILLKRRMSVKRKYNEIPLKLVSHNEDRFSELTDDEVSVLFFLLCFESGRPDFSDTVWLDLLIEIRQSVFKIHFPVTCEEAKQKLDRMLILLEWKEWKGLTTETRNDIMYSILHRVDTPDAMLYLFSFITTQKYLRSLRYTKTPGEKCVIGKTYYCDSLLIQRLQLNILNHDTMEDTEIFKEISQSLMVPMDIIRGTKNERKEFVENLKQIGKIIYNKRRNFHDQHVKWLWRYRTDARPDIVKSCIGLYPHSDIFVIDNMAYRKSIKHHGYKWHTRCMLYCLLLVDEYTLNINEISAFNETLESLRERYFDEHHVIMPTKLHEGIVHIEDDKIMFASDSIRHDVMCAFVTECLVTDSDLEFFLTTASRNVISEYCRSWGYEKKEGERCIFVPSIPESMYDLFIDKLQLDIITHCTVSDQNIHGRINKHFGVPKEVLQWEQEARERYVKYTRRGTQTVHHARGMIVGCAGAGKTTLLTRLLNPENKGIPNVPSTEGLEVHEEIFEICDGKLKVKSNTGMDISEKKKPGETNDSLGDDITKTVSFFDFGGQCAYYACHQIYLTRRAFYILVVDASKQLYQVVDKNTCDQEDTVFNGWTYKDYFEFWLKSIHTYCSQPTKKEENIDVVIVVTHWENRIDQDTKAFDKILRNALSPHSNLGQYIGDNSLFYVQFPLEPLEELEKFIVDLALSRKWSEKIPHEWEFLNQEIEENRMIKHILSFHDVCKRMPVNETEKNESTKDMLRYYHDAGKVLYFNEEGLNKIVIIDVQWFVDAFKNIITDTKHVKGINTVKHIWDEYYTTGILQSELLNRIWKKEDEKLMKSLLEENASFEKDGPRFLMYHKQVLLSYMQRLGLIAIGETSHYVPCMNKKPFADQQMDIIKKAPLRSSVLVFLFDFLPFFLFYRLVVKLMVNKTFQVLKDKDISCLYKNAALFSYKNHNIAVAVTSTTIQLQVYQPEPRLKLKKKVTVFIRESIEQAMEVITTTFHKHLSYRMGYICDEEEDQTLGKEIADNFIDETGLQTREKMTCPNHQNENRHNINPGSLQSYWKLSTSGGHLCACAVQGCTLQEPF